MRPRKNVSLKTIADAVGVSVVSVSNALSGRGGVSPELRKTICDMAAEMGYQHKTEERTAQTMVSRKIAILTKRSSMHTDGGKWIQYAEAAGRILKENGSTVSADRMQNETEGIFLVGQWNGEDIVRIKEQYALPVVVIGDWNIYERGDYIVSDAYHGVFDAVDRLYREGEARPGMVACAPEAELRDYEYGLWCGLSEFYGMPLEERQNVFHSAQEAMESDCQTLFCFSQEDAAFLEKKGKRVIGCREEVQTQESVLPDKEGMAQEAIRVLMRRIRQQGEPEGVRYVQEICQIK